MAGSSVLDAKMTLENSGFVAGMSRAREASTRALETFKTVALGVSGLGTAFAALRGVDAFADGIRGAFEQGRQLAILARQSSQSVKDTVELRQAFTEEGISADLAGTAIFMLQKALGGVSEEGVPTSYAFRRIGLSLEELRKMTPLQQFRAIDQGLKRLPDPAAKASVAMQIFGRSARDLQGLLNDPKGFEEAIKNSAAYATTMQRNAAAFEQVEKTVESIQFKVRDFYAGIAAGVAPGLQAVLNSINKIDLAKLGAQIGNALGVLYEAFKSGKLSDLLATSLKLGFERAVNTFAGIMGAVANAMGAVIPTVFSPDLWKGIKAGFEGVVESFTGGMMAIAPKLLAGLREVYDRFQAWMQNTPYETYKKKHDDADLRNELMSRVDVPLSSHMDKDRSQWVDAMMRRRDAGQDSSFLDLKNLDSDGLSQPTKLSQVKQVGYSFAGGTPEDWSAKGDQDLGKANAFLSKPIADFIKAITDAISSAKAANVFTVAQLKALQDKQDSIINGFKAALAADSADPKMAATGATSPGFSFKRPDGDRLAKLGLFIGGSPATPGLSEARRTANATEATHKGVQQLINSIALTHAPRYPGVYL